MGTIARLPHSNVAKTNATLWDILKSRCLEVSGRLLKFVSAPGFVRNASFQDSLTGRTIDIKVGILFTRLSIDGRDYYFHRVTGKFDGTGSGCS